MAGGYWGRQNDAAGFEIIRFDWWDTPLKAAVQTASIEATMEAALAILADANEHVPFLTGMLHDTGRVDKMNAQGAGGAIISYDTVYARHLHEHPEYNFRNGREGKWLEHALQRAPRPVMAAMVTYMSQAIGTGTFGKGAVGAIDNVGGKTWHIELKGAFGWRPATTNKLSGAFTSMAEAMDLIADRDMSLFRIVEDK
jgi:hypothetical protein